MSTCDLSVCVIQSAVTTDVITHLSHSTCMFHWDNIGKETAQIPRTTVLLKRPAHQDVQKVARCSQRFGIQECHGILAHPSSKESTHGSWEARRSFRLQCSLAPCLWLTFRLCQRVLRPWFPETQQREESGTQGRQTEAYYSRCDQIAIVKWEL